MQTLLFCMPFFSLKRSYTVSINFLTNLTLSHLKILTILKSQKLNIIKTY